MTRYFEAGVVSLVGRAEDGIGSRLLDELEEQMASFPRAAHDDLVDAMVYGVMRGAGLVSTTDDVVGVVWDDRVEISRY